MLFAPRNVGRHAASSFQQSAHPSKKSRQPLFGACLFPRHIPSLQSLPHSSHRPPTVGLLAHTLPPARGLTSGRPLRSPWRLASLNSSQRSHRSSLQPCSDLTLLSNLYSLHQKKMKNQLPISNKDSATLPKVPFTIYFKNRKGAVQPKRLYTVTAISNNKDGFTELYVSEFKRKIIFDFQNTNVSKFFVN